MYYQNNNQVFQVLKPTIAKQYLKGSSRSTKALLMLKSLYKLPINIILTGNFYLAWYVRKAVVASVVGIIVSAGGAGRLLLGLTKLLLGLVASLTTRSTERPEPLTISLWPTTHPLPEITKEKSDISIVN